MSREGLVVSGLTVRYGGNTALEGLHFEAPEGRITGLIGPNGAGKTTALNACSGLVRPSAGRIEFGGRDLTHLSPARRAQLGLARTFQVMQLFESLTVYDNIALGHEAGIAGSRPIAHLFGSARQRAEVAAATEEAVHLCGIEDLVNAVVSALSTGQRRLVELARAVAARATLLLLDEPSSGLDRMETERFGDILLQLVDRRGVGLLLIEHDMSLVMRVCAYLYVLDFGKPLFEGSPEEVQRSEVVQRAYLGSAA